MRLQRTAASRSFKASCSSCKNGTDHQFQFISAREAVAPANLHCRALRVLAYSRVADMVDVALALPRHVGAARARC